MVEYNPFLFAFWNVQARPAKRQLLILTVIFLVFLLCLIQVPLGLAGSMQSKSDIGGLVVGKSLTQGGGDTVPILDVAQINQGGIESVPKSKALGVPNGGTPVFLGSPLAQPVAEDRGHGYSKDCYPGESRE